MTISATPTTSGGGIKALSAVFPDPFSLTAAEKILNSARPRHVDVVIAPPGRGKSVFTREVIASRLTAGTLKHVLWATQSIVSKSALGEEALAHFRFLGVLTAEIVYGRAAHRALKIPGSYSAQFTWPAGPMVKIISHARVRHIFGGTDLVSATLAGADLLVIDEDPSSGLLLASPTRVEGKAGSAALTPYTLSTLAGTGDAVCQALAEVAERVPAAVAPQIFQRDNGYVHGSGLYGEFFWTEFNRLHPHPVDVLSLQAALEKCKVENSTLIAEAFAEDARLSTSSPFSQRSRFGLHWIGQGLTTEKALLRFNLRQPLRLNLPVIVLDGYANDRLYTPLFNEQVVQLHEFARADPLEIECAPELYVCTLDEGTKKGKRNRLQVAEELAQQRRLTPKRKQLTLVSKRLEAEKSQWQGFMIKAYGDRGLKVTRDDATTDVHQMYWHAGRGRNAYAGADVYALHAPGLSAMNRHYTLAAVLPDDPTARDELQAHALGAELLQMLNRGRQPNFPAGTKPRIIVGAPESYLREVLAEFADRVEFSEYEPLLKFTAFSQNPRWRDMTAALASELLELEPFKEGLPRRLLEGLPKHKHYRKDVYDKLATLASSADKASHLYQAFHDPMGWQYHDVDPGGTGSDKGLLSEAMTQAGLTAVQRLNTRGKPYVYVPAGGCAETASWMFENWLSPPPKIPWPEFDD